MAADEGPVLPFDVLVEVLSHLEVQEMEESVAPVCRLWRDASRLPVVRRRLTLTKKIPPSAAHGMLRSSPLLTQLKINRCGDTDDLLRTAAAHNLKLRVLVIIGDVSDIGLEAMAQCDELRLLLLCNERKVTDDGIVHLARMSLLENLQLSAWNSVTPDCWRRLFSMYEWPHLRELSLALNQHDEDVVPRVDFERLPTTLRSIELNFCVSDIDLEAVAQCDRLRTLMLHDVGNVTEDGVVHLAQLRHLEKLELRGRNSVTAAGWRRLFTVCEWPHLRELTLSLRYADRDVLHFQRLPTTLRSLELSGAVTDTDLEAVAQCDQLRTLSLLKTPRVTDDGVVPLARLRHLEELVLYSSSVTQRGWCRLFSICEWPHLRELSLRLCDADIEVPRLQFDRLRTALRSLELYERVTDVELEAVAQCDELRTLSLRDAFGFTDEGVVHLAQLHHLVKFELRGVNSVTPAGWRRLFSMCEWPHLRELCLQFTFTDREGHFESLPAALRSLKLRGCVSDVDLEAVARCDELRKLLLYDASGVTDEGVVHLARLSHLQDLELWGAIRVTPAGWRRLFSICEWPRKLNLYLPGLRDRDDIFRQTALRYPNFRWI